MAFGGPAGSIQSFGGPVASIQSLPGTEQPAVVAVPCDHGVGETDPLLRRGSKVLHDGKEDLGIGKQETTITVEMLWKRILLLSLGSCTLYLFMATVVALFFDNWPFWVWLTLLITLAKSGLVWKFLKRRWLTYLGPYLAAGSLVGFMFGLAAYYTSLLPYLRYMDAEKHTNVAASEHALRFADTGMVTFSPGTTVDVTRSVGYMSARAGAKMCVAPVVDVSMGAEDPINFYAVGVNCCGWRGSFECDDAGVPQARSALLELDMNAVVGNWTAWMLQDTTTSEGLKAAMKLQESVFRTKAAPNVRFLHWSRDPLAMIRGYLTQAVQVIADGLGVVALVSVVIGMKAATGRVRFWKVVEFSEDGKSQGSFEWGSYRFNKRAGRQKKMPHSFL
mmetsp:Transcript_74183/g.143592  ORF Transcript_74183/g.143592 Transcript_74183/m.143592 type:complete len:391 (+) Transcript_74183:133-1305(+)